jgi:hypothetical protein
MLAPIEEIFCTIDDDFKEILEGHEKRLLPNPDRQRQRACRLCFSEIATIMVLFHMSQYRTFKDYYHECVIKTMRGYFPSLVSYNRFVELQKTVIPYLIMFLQRHKGEETGIYFVDATKLPVCHNKRIFNHKVFKDIAKRGKTTTGWFFGFKLHIVINQKGELMSFFLTPGNVDDRKPLKSLFKKLCGLGFGDAGYVGKTWQESLGDMGLKFITTIKKNMTKPLLSKLEKLLLRKRGIIETVIDQLKNICQIDHTRHRSPDNFVANLVSGLAAYFFKPRKPKINTSQLTHLPLLTSN